MSAVVTITMLSVTAGSAAIGAARRILERRRARRELREKPLLQPQSTEGTVVRATGIVRVLDRTLIAPLSGIECVVVRSRVTTGRGAMAPSEVFAMVPFLLERADGTVSIEGAHALLDLDPIARVGKRAKSPADSARRDAFVLAQGVDRKRAARAIFAETVVEPGMTVTVAGLMMKDVIEAPVETDERGFREAGPVALRLAGNADHPLVIGAPDEPAKNASAASATASGAST